MFEMVSFQMTDDRLQ